MLLGALANASQAMQAMDVSMGTISQNVANVNTTGYKKEQTLFQTVLSENIKSGGISQNSTTDNSTTSGLNIFGVMPTNRNLISLQGTINPTNTWTDLAINGRGFFMVTPPDSTGTPQASSGSANTLFTRAGTFQQKAVGTNSYFTDSSGNYLMGWMADAQGNIPGVTTSAHSGVASTPATGGSGSLVPIYTQPGQLITGVATTNIQAGMNLPADATATASPQTFTDTSTITDGTGAAQDLTMTWTRVDGDNWSVAFSLPTTPASGSVGTISPSSSPAIVTMDASGNITAVNPASASGTGYAPLIIDWSSGPTITTTPSINLASQKPTLQEVPVSLTVYDNAYNAETLPVTFERAGNDQWYMRVNVPPAAGTVSALTASGATAGSSSIPITFDGTGHIVSPSSLGFSVAWTPSVTPTAPATVPIPTVLTAYSSSITTAVGTVTAPSLPATAAQLATYGTALDTALAGVAVAAPATAADLTAYSASLVSALSTASDATQTALTKAAAAAGTSTVTFDPSKMTQFVGASPTTVDIKTITQDGYASGVMDSASFTSTGELIAHFNNGQTRTLAMVPVASFVAPDQLNPVSGTLFQATQAAGAETIGSIGSQGSGAQIEASAVETSNVDLADEFSRMILTQTAYSMNSKVFTTADEMFQTSRDLLK